ncbi:MAG TPA: SUF system Fe-S cluster assembly regulator [Gammaproteobacteria bacterium]|nr:SUF system Fe-S cluster assembly regulator [Gammaproteobacteria bacterium]
MLRLSKLTDYGTVVLSQMARDPGRLHAAAEIATATHLAAPTVSKLLKQFARAGLVSSHRGARGGYSLTRPAEQITAVQIIDAIEGPVAITQCSMSHSRCGIEAVCGIGHNWQRISLAIRDSLSTVTLAQLARPVALPPRLDFRAVLDGTPSPQKQ